MRIFVEKAIRSALELSHSNEPKLQTSYFTNLNLRLSMKIGMHRDTFDLLPGKQGKIAIT